MIEHGVVWRRWEQALSEYWNSNLTVAEYCRQHDLRIRAARKWIKRLRPEMAEKSVMLDIVKLEPPSMASFQPWPPSRGDDSGISLELGTIRVRLDRDFNSEALGRVLSLLEVR